MGKKYIIEINDEDRVVNGHIRIPFELSVEGLPGKVGFSYTIENKLIPYTEPDLDAIKQEEYEKGYKTAKVQCDIQTEKDLREVGERHYQKGLSDAWEAARKICANWCISDDDLALIFGKGKTIDDIMREFTATEAIEKIRQYEQEKEQPVTAEDVMRQYLDTFCKGRSCTNCLLCTPDFTCGRGKHFLHNCVSDEEVRRAYAAVLAKMKES